jgi:hypothetical protein
MESEELLPSKSVQKPTEAKNRSKYVYTPEGNRELSKTHYDRLHEIETYLRCGDLPSRIDNKVTRQAFKASS